MQEFAVVPKIALPTGIMSTHLLLLIIAFSIWHHRLRVVCICQRHPMMKMSPHCKSTCLIHERVVFLNNSWFISEMGVSIVVAYTKISSPPHMTNIRNIPTVTCAVPSLLIMHIVNSK
ncbi:hypothetical protein JHK82_017509 [Glycine max]|uniref:Uncharacterized protein n=1 Tax=Glycine max TaxID=3847 RepID=A0A0R0J3A3_SOYBN|nr:hypothetical protein JHK87_017451 [Glycine soja]KAG5021604.1 hypothetical protein JHK85_017946 [Glycine max]KAG5036721.1 hypothetical protein JHK86_017561 [Glycine max]KAG5141814.1 hypothetical protein JHK82_017509 [Glycine max]KAH1085338.1 hypothetical protein GYH30_017364 [Glycine max]